jgi:hypothetical protein
MFRVSCGTGCQTGCLMNDNLRNCILADMSESGRRNESRTVLIVGDADYSAKLIPLASSTILALSEADIGVDACVSTKRS